MEGMNKAPLAVYALEDRFTCGKCHGRPRILSASAEAGLVTVKLSCCGQEATKMLEKKELIFQQIVFAEE